MLQNATITPNIPSSVLDDLLTACTRRASFRVKSQIGIFRIRSVSAIIIKLPNKYLTLGRPKWVIRDPMSQHFKKFMRLNADNSFMLCVFLNCVYLLYYANVNFDCLFPKKIRKPVPESRETQFRAFVWV
jgi:hypothetical protein